MRNYVRKRELIGYDMFGLHPHTYIENTIQHGRECRKRRLKALSQVRKYTYPIQASIQVSLLYLTFEKPY